MILSAITGKPVMITIKNLNNYQKEIISKACDFVEEKLKGTEYEEVIGFLMKVTGFCVTNSKHLDALYNKAINGPLVIINSKVITGLDTELAVTILHELLHAVHESDDRDPASLEEARHDLACYGLLGIPVPLSHWAFTKYPFLLDEIRRDVGDIESNNKNNFDIPT